MKHQFNSLDNKSVKDIDLEKAIFGVPYREDIIYRMIRNQAAKKPRLNHKT